MAGKICLVWAVPVDESQLIARINAYVKTRASITTFELCLKYSTSKKVRQGMPAEITGMIADSLQGEEYREMYPRWHFVRRCMLDECEFSDHLAKDEIMDLLDSDLKWEHPQWYLWKTHNPRHDKVVEHYLKTIRFIKSNDNASMLARGKEASCSRSSLSLDDH